jgi:hypothetical protein
VSHHPVQGQDSHGAHTGPEYSHGDHANAEQLDAGMHPAHEGLSAMPFYDDFDLSTVDVLLISQYVYARLACHGSWGSAHHWSRTMSAQRALAVQRLVYHYEWNIICILPLDFDDVPLPWFPPMYLPFARFHRPRQ